MRGWSRRFVAQWLLSFVLVVVFARSAYAGPRPASCLLYGVDSQTRDSQLFTVDLRSRTSSALGGTLHAYDLSGIAIHPGTGLIYGVSGERATNPGHLLLIDGGNAEITDLGSTGFTSVSGLTFRADETLWTWARGGLQRSGLVQLDLTTGRGTLRVGSQLPLVGIGWQTDTRLYGAFDGQLWSIETTSGVASRQFSVPRGLEAFIVRKDGALLAAQDDPRALQFAVVRPASRNVVRTFDVPLYSGFRGVRRAIAWFSRCGNASTGGSAAMITDVSIDKSSICLGDSVRVAVRATHPEMPESTVDVSINGLVGSTRYLQFTKTAGARFIAVSAKTEDRFIDSRLVRVDVGSCTSQDGGAEVVVQPSLYEDLAADFTVANVGKLGLSSPSYRWDFGDGKSAVTSVPYVAHSYRDGVPVDRRYATFQAKLSIIDGARTLVTPKTVSVWNLYGENRQHGFVHPTVDYSPTLRPLVDGRFGQVITITNRDTAPLVLTARADELQYCDSAREPSVAPAAPISITIPALSAANVTVAIDQSTLTSDVCGAAVHFSGSAGSAQALVDAYFEVRANAERSSRESDPAILTLLNRAALEGLVDDPLRITEQDLERLAREGRLPYPTVSTSGTALSQLRPFGITTTTADLLGKDCRPGELPPRPGISCRPTADDWVIIPPRIANALKGDILLTPGCGFIGSLVRTLGQTYSHEYVLANNYYDLVHSTSTDDFLKHNPHPFGTLGETTEGIREDALKFGFPGTLTQTVLEARLGSRLLYEDPAMPPCEPDTEGCQNHFYVIKGFNPNPERCKGDVEINRPLVLKPPPSAAKALRPSLHTAADKALTIRGHYRLFAYSRGDISVTPSFDGPEQYPRLVAETHPDGTVTYVNQPADIWATGTRATHSSQFIWTAFREAGLTLEGGELEPADFPFVEIDPSTPDGQYFYRGGERLAAARFVYSDTYNKARNEAGFFGELLTDAADDLANQITNCFAFDRCSRAAGDSTDWEDPGDGRTVSPDDLRSWDLFNAPADKIFRYDEPLIYRSGEWVRRHTWVADENTGSVSGRVFVNGLPAVEATVVLIGVEESTDAQGRFQFPAIPAGTHSIEARRLINGTLFSKRQEITVEAGKTVDVRIDLEPPEESRRLVHITGTLHVVDTEDLGGDEIDDFTVDTFCRVDPFDRLSFAPGVEQCTGDEVRVKVGFQCELQGDGPGVNVKITMELFEGTDCQTEDKEGETSSGPNFVPPGAAPTYSLQLVNTEVNSPDRAELTVTVSNEKQP